MISTTTLLALLLSLMFALLCKADELNMVATLQTATVLQTIMLTYIIQKNKKGEKTAANSPLCCIVRCKIKASLASKSREAR